jgi:hypothetical protein
MTETAPCDEFVDISLEPWQIDFIECQVQNQCLMAGRRAGKTHAIRTKMQLLLAAYAGFRAMYITPLSNQGLEVYKQLISDEWFKEHIGYKQMRPYPIVVLKNRSQLLFRSFQRPDNIRSTGEDLICPDEIQDPCYTEWTLDTAILPMLSDRIYPVTNDGTRGRLIIAGQFRGENYIYEKFWLPGQREINGKQNTKFNPRYRSWQIPSSMGHNFLTPGGKDELNAIQSRTEPSAYDQEYACIPRANKNACFSAGLVNPISIDRVPKLKCGSMGAEWNGGLTVAGVDIGQKIDFSAITIIDRFGNVVYSETCPRQSHESSAERVAQVALHFRAQCLLTDCTGGGRPGQPQSKFTDILKLYREACYRRGLSFKPFFFQNQKQRVVVNLELAMQQKRIGIPAECEELIKQLKYYEYQHNPKTNWTTYSAPSGMHDDECASCILAWEAFSSGCIGSGETYAGAI